MITLPAVQVLNHARLYHDSADSQLLYIDVLQPAPVIGSEVLHWQPLPEQLAYLVGEIRFGPSADDLQRVSAQYPAMRVLPMPWESSPVMVWSQTPDAVRVLAAGKTSGFGLSNAIFNATAPARAMIEPVLVAAELIGSAQLTTATISGFAVEHAVPQALTSILGTHKTGWNKTIGELLVWGLRQLLTKGVLALRITPDRLASSTVGELQEVALLEWAHRIAEQHVPRLSLAAPALQVENWQAIQHFDCTLNWQINQCIPVRTIRTFSGVASQ